MKHKSFILLLTFCILTSCAVYTPQVNTPVLFEEAGEVQIDGGFSGMPASDRLTVFSSVSYSVSQKLFVNSHIAHTVHGLTHLEGNLGWKNRFGKSRFSIIGMAGFGFGVGNTEVSDEILDDYSMCWDGYYRTVSGKFMFLYQADKVNIAFGAKLGSFSPSFGTITYNEDGFITETFDVTQRGVLNEQFMSIGFNLDENLALNFSGTLAKIEALSRTDYPEELNTTSPIQFGIGISYRIK